MKCYLTDMSVFQLNCKIFGYRTFKIWLELEMLSVALWTGEETYLKEEQLEAYTERS